MHKENNAMARQHSSSRRRFLATAGLAATGAPALTTPASAKSTPTIRKQAEIPYKPDVLVVGGGIVKQMGSFIGTFRSQFSPVAQLEPFAP